MREALTVRIADNPRDLEAFVRLPWAVYRGDRNWVPPLLSERRERLDASRNPFHRHSTVELYLARRGRRPVGTVGVFADHQANATLDQKVGGFGFFEVLPDFDAAQALLDTACAAARRWGMSSIKGPTNFGENDEPGVLMGGADCPPALLEAHTPGYYAEFLERFGMVKHTETYAYRVSLNDVRAGKIAFPDQMRRVFDAASHGRFRVRPLRLDDWEREVETAHRLFNLTLKDLPGTQDMPVEEFRKMAGQLRSLIDPDLALFAEIDGRVVGFMVAIPDVNRVLIHLNGRLFPIGWLKALWYQRRIDTVSFKLFGVLEEYRRRGIDVLLYLTAVRAALDKGYKWLDGSLTSEFNPTVVRLAERLGAERYKVYRLYQMAL